MMADAVRAWDYHIRKDSVGATAIRFWREQYGTLRPDALSEANEAYSAPRTDAEQLDAVKALRAIGTQRRDEAGRFVFDSGQVVTTVVELSDPVQVRSIVPFGQSRRPASPHYADQARLYSAGQMRSAWHTWSQLRDHVGSKVVLEYRPSRP
jgi:acyl-homoserine lactone acylase PvdQ